MTAERQIDQRPVFLPDRGSLIKFDFPVAGSAGFLAAKVATLNRRNNAKEACGMLWLMDAWPSCPNGLAQTIVGGGGMSLLTAVHGSKEDGHAADHRGRRR